MDVLISTKVMSHKVSTNLNLSFSGLKSHITKLINSESNNLLSKNYIEDMAASFQKTIAEILINKIEKAIIYCDNKFPNYSNVVISGGVASNLYLRRKFIKAIIDKKKEPFIPSAKLCTDNGAMIAWAGYEKYKYGISSPLNFKALPRWPLEKEYFYE